MTSTPRLASLLLTLLVLVSGVIGNDSTPPFGAVDLAAEALRREGVR